MSLMTEKALKSMHEFLDQYDTENMTIDEINDLIKKHTEEYNRNVSRVTEKNASSAEDYLELAENAENKSKAFTYANKALKLDPDNLDAERLVIMAGSKGYLQMLSKTERAIIHGDKVIRKLGFDPDSDDEEFWLAIETRPYMRLRDFYAAVLVQCGMMKRAAHEYEELIRICPNDNLGCRHTLMHIYALLEDLDSAEKLHSKYDEHEETMILLPLSVLYFKQGDFKNAEKHLKKLSRINKDTAKFLKIAAEGDVDRLPKIESEFGYSPFTLEEFKIEADENPFLMYEIWEYYSWADEVLNGKKR